MPILMLHLFAGESSNPAHSSVGKSLASQAQARFGLKDITFQEICTTSQHWSVTGSVLLCSQGACGPRTIKFGLAHIQLHGPIRVYLRTNGDLAMPVGRHWTVMTEIDASPQESMDPVHSSPTSPTSSKAVTASSGPED